MFLEQTLFYIQESNVDKFNLDGSIASEITNLSSLGLVKMKKKGADDMSLVVEATDLGKAAFKGE